MTTPPRDTENTTAIVAAAMFPIDGAAVERYRTGQRVESAAVVTTAIAAYGAACQSDRACNREDHRRTDRRC